jgi:hypothetical protein
MSEQKYLCTYNVDDRDFKQFIVTEDQKDFLEANDHKYIDVTDYVSDTFHTHISGAQLCDILSFEPVNDYEVLVLLKFGAVHESIISEDPWCSVPDTYYYLPCVESESDPNTKMMFDCWDTENGLYDFEDEIT